MSAATVRRKVMLYIADVLMFAASICNSVSFTHSSGFSEQTFLIKYESMDKELISFSKPSDMYVYFTSVYSLLKCCAGYFFHYLSFFL
jgi:hypothetical protein